MEFKKYQHVERFGCVEVDGILNGKVYLFDKIDGTNSQIWVDDNSELHFGSRNRELTLDYDNHNFMSSLHKDERLIKFFNDNKNLKLYGEWLKPHTIKHYDDEAWNKFYVFDVVDENGEYLIYEDYSKLLKQYNIDFIPVIAILNNPSYEDLTKYLDKISFLVKDGSGMGEGIVIKNYQYRNRFGHRVWAKIVLDEFKAKHRRIDVSDVDKNILIEQKIVDKYVTKSLVEKEYAKLCVDEWFDKKLIPRLFSTIYYSLIKEDSWNFVKEFKNPTINFKTLEFSCREKVKEYLPMLF